VVAVTQATQVGVVANVVRVASEEAESNYRNNVAAALARVIGPLAPPVALRVCRTLTAEPRALQSGRTSVVRVTARNRVGKPLSGIPVRVLGAGVARRALTDTNGIARFAVTPTRIGIVQFVGGERLVAGGRSQCRTLLGVLSGEATVVTG
jgi:hypothetical protein